jgi:hypothetical protein
MGDDTELLAETYFRYEPSPILIETRYYDPVTSTTTAFAGVHMDVVEASAGIFYKPYKEYKSGRAATNSSLKSASGSHVDLGTSKADDSSMKSEVSRPAERSSASTAGAMATASAKSLGDLYVKGIKGLAVDIPLAAAKGLHNVPALYGDEVRDNRKVKDWKSGTIVGGKVGTTSLILINDSKTNIKTDILVWHV